MQQTRRHTAIGRFVLAIAKRLGKKKARENRVKLGAAGVVALALTGGLLAARSSD